MKKQIGHWIYGMVIGFLVLAIYSGYVARFTEVGQACVSHLSCTFILGQPATWLPWVALAHPILSWLAAGLVIGWGAWRLSVGRQGLSSFERWGLISGILMLALQGLVGVVLHKSAWVPPRLLHLGLGLAAMTALGLSALSTLSAFQNPIGGSTGSNKRLALLGLGVVGLTFVLMVSGFANGLDEGSRACGGWPLCGGSLMLGNWGWSTLIHRLISLLVLVGMMYLIIRVWRDYDADPLVLPLATAVGVLFMGQIGVGGWMVGRGYPADMVALHALNIVALWGVLIALVYGLWTRPPRSAEKGSDTTPLRVRLRAYFLLNKPVIVALLLVTTYTGMVLAAKGMPDLLLTFWTLLGGALAAGGASAINQYIDRDVDRRMQRTARRPIPSGILTPAQGLAYGVAACLVAFFLLAGKVNLLSALLALAGMIYYVGIYSLWLKPATTQNIVIGGGAGAIPPLVGWAAVTNDLQVPALFLFAIIFFWTPPHFWALALVRQKDYARAGIPMLPVVRGEKVTRWQIFIYTLELVALTLLMPLFNLTGRFFMVTAILLGAWLIYAAWRVLHLPGHRPAYQMYRISSMYLALVFLALVVDVLI